MQEAYDFGLILQRLRKQRGWTQEQLAEKIQKESSIISRYEKNLQNPTFDTVRSFAAIFNVSMDYLSGMEKPTCLSVAGLTQSQQELVAGLAEAFRSQNIRSAYDIDEHYKLLGKIAAEMAKQI